MFGRIGLFLITNLLIMLVFSVAISVLGVGNYMTASGIDYSAMLIFCLVWGFTASFVSLAISRWTAKTFLGVKVISPDSAGEYQWLLNMVHQQAKAAGLPAMPEVGIYQSGDVNAFATGPSKSRSLVAFSSGIISFMSRDELEGVSAHEVAHIQNGDMVTMTLLQGLVNAFVMFFARIIAYAASNAVDEKLSGIVWMVVYYLCFFAFMFLGSLVTSWFSRKREFRADAGSAQIAGREKMIAGLQALQRLSANDDEVPESIAALAISGKSRSGFTALFSTHPPLEERVAALKNLS